MSTGESNGLPVKRESGEPGHPKDNLEQGELFPSELAKRAFYKSNSRESTGTISVHLPWPNSLRPQMQRTSASSNIA